MLPINFHVVDIATEYGKDVKQALTKFALAPLSFMDSENTYHVSISDHLASGKNMFYFEYASSEEDVKEPAAFDVLGPESTLVLGYDEVIVPDSDDETPYVERHIVTVELLIYDKDGNLLLANINSLYRTYAAMYFNALGLFPERFEKGAAYIGDQFILG